MNDEPVLLTLTEACERYRLRLHQLIRIHQANPSLVFRAGRSVRIRREKFDRFINQTASVPGEEGHAAAKRGRRA